MFLSLGTQWRKTGMVPALLQLHYSAGNVSIQRINNTRWNEENQAEQWGRARCFRSLNGEMRSICKGDTCVPSRGQQEPGHWGDQAWHIWRQEDQCGQNKVSGHHCGRRRGQEVHRLSRETSWGVWTLRERQSPALRGLWAREWQSRTDCHETQRVHWGRQAVQVCEALRKT